MQTLKIITMKKIMPIIRVVLTAFFIITLFSQCYKEPTYSTIVECLYVDDDGKTIGPVANCYVEIGKPGNAEFAQANGVTDEKGLYRTEFEYQAILDVFGYIEFVELLQHSNDSMDYFVLDTAKWYGEAIIKLQPDEVVTTTVYVSRVYE